MHAHVHTQVKQNMAVVERLAAARLTEARELSKLLGTLSTVVAEPCDKVELEKKFVGVRYPSMHNSTIHMFCTVTAQRTAGACVMQ